MPAGNLRSLTCSGAILSALLAVGCAAQVTQSWVGRPIDSALVRYGPPVEVAEVSGGRKAYRWRIERGEGVRVNAQGMSTVATSGGSVDHCILTLTTGWNREAGRWLVEEANGPRCP